MAASSNEPAGRRGWQLVGRKTSDSVQGTAPPEDTKRRATPARIARAAVHEKDAPDDYHLDGFTVGRLPPILRLRHDSRLQNMVDKSFTPLAAESL